MICNSNGTVLSTNFLLIMNQLASLDLSRDLQPNHAKSFVNRLYLVLQIGKIPTQIFFCVYRLRELNRALVLVLLKPLNSFGSQRPLRVDNPSK